MTQITEHHGEQKRERNDRIWCRIHFPVTGNTVGIDERLEGLGKLVGPIVSRWILESLHSIQNRWNRRPRAFLDWEIIIVWQMCKILVFLNIPFRDATQSECFRYPAREPSIQQSDTFG